MERSRLVTGGVSIYGDHLANEETLAKLHLGRAWQEQAGPGYRYFLVFKDKDISMTRAYPMSEFLRILAEMQPHFCAIGNKNAGNEQQNARRA